jgi:hypothetical protein
LRGRGSSPKLNPTACPARANYLWTRERGLWLDRGRKKSRCWASPTRAHVASQWASVCRDQTSMLTMLFRLKLISTTCKEHKTTWFRSLALVVSRKQANFHGIEEHALLPITEQHLGKREHTLSSSRRREHK